MRRPTSKEYLKEFIEKTILPSSRKQSNSLFFVKGTGRNSIIRHISENRANVKEEVGASFDDVILLEVDTHDRNILLGSWLKMLRDQDMLTDDFKDLSLIEIVVKVTRDLKKRVLLCVWVSEEGVDVPFLESLRQANSMMVDFQFSFPFEVEKAELKSYLGNLTQFAFQNLWYLPLYENNDVDVIIKNQVDQGFVDVTDSQVEQIKNLSGGYPRLVRFFLRNPDEISGDSWSDPEVNHFFDEIWDGLSDESKKNLFDLVSNDDVDEVSEYLIKTKLLHESDGKYSFFSEMFLEYVKELANSLPISVKEKDGKVMVDGKNLETLLSVQEFDVFKLLLEKRGEVVSRDSVAEALWGDNWQDKYSDWAIDQMVSRIRKKIGDRTSKALIKTIRGKGFIIS